MARRLTVVRSTADHEPVVCDMAQLIRTLDLVFRDEPAGEGEYRARCLLWCLLTERVTLEQARRLIFKDGDRRALDELLFGPGDEDEDDVQDVDTK